jgi:hypothetical protein
LLASPHPHAPNLGIEVHVHLVLEHHRFVRLEPPEKQPARPPSPSPLATLTATADNSSLYYGTANPTFIDKAQGFVNNGVVSGAAALTAATAGSAPGKYPSTVDGSPLSAANYAIPPANDTPAVALDRALKAGGTSGAAPAATWALCCPSARATSAAAELLAISLAGPRPGADTVVTPALEGDLANARQAL